LAGRLLIEARGLTVYQLERDQTMVTETAGPDIEAQRTAWSRANVMALWESLTAHKPPPGPVAGHLWPWQVLRSLALDTAKIKSPSIVERRVLQLTNPYRTSPADESTVKNLAAAIQVLLPGESARPHRHSMNALRFVLEGEGAVTVVDGKPCPMHVGDLILTPAWCWHEHSHGGSSPVIWLDALDVPLHAYHGTAQFEPGPVKAEPVTVPDASFSVPNFLPEIIPPSAPYSPVFRYPYSDAVNAVRRAPPSPCGARIVRYVNPLTGGAPMSTMDCRLMQLEAGSRTRPYRMNGNAVLLVVEGEGRSRIGNVNFDWRPTDIITVPQGNWASHLASDGVARLLVISDREALRRLGFFEESYGDESDGIIS
jgi:gentisate 1,2-dioxygenase